MSGAIDRRLSALEARTGVGGAQRLLVKHRPDGLEPAIQAAWDAVDASLPADLVVTIRHFCTWPPRDAADAQTCLATGLCADRAELTLRVLAMPPYPEQQAALAGLHVA